VWPTGKVLAGGSLLVGNRLRIGEISKLIAGLRTLGLDVLCNGTCTISNVSRAGNQVSVSRDHC
jgi:hypothetical protein